ncbi:uncharacterized protein Z519_01064 [Cladophialophora bantiana CBS 173.52]|uniref:Uncharacterized protein n=1 Tax=Cladophialophora bantiana (strain ATCC 10958 / CBS 173.52 / CDC B-1940 / NIH 8579) TaxID=1442370 RepID=A0A0D2I2T5_CLAB1|nr:uncharacterized protein Z519_01064 [Cladophialophora bantiana CBS 173.52]KIW97480.1 hypothetical protein Z519_01064 [Cladophialophora bantiana CBS 173.52]
MSSDPMTPVIRNGNFTMISNKNLPAQTWTSTPPHSVWLNLSAGEKAGIGVGVGLALLGLLVGVVLLARRRSRRLEDPSNSVNRGQLIAEADGTMIYRPSELDAVCKAV